jgi:hypothetical protein
MMPSVRSLCSAVLLLSFSRISPTVDPKDDLFIFHANPQDVKRHIYPPVDKQKAVYGEVRQPDDDPALRHMLREIVCGTLAFGHVHIPSVRRWQDLVLANIRSVSLARDGDRRAKYGLFTWRGDGAGKLNISLWNMTWTKSWCCWRIYNRQTGNHCRANWRQRGLNQCQQLVFSQRLNSTYS